MWPRGFRSRAERSGRPKKLWRELLGGRLGTAENCVSTQRAEREGSIARSIGRICASDAAAHCDASSFCGWRNVTGADGGYVRNWRRRFRYIQHLNCGGDGSRSGGRACGEAWKIARPVRNAVARTCWRNWAFRSICRFERIGQGIREIGIGFYLRRRRTPPPGMPCLRGSNWACGPFLICYGP